MEMGEDRNLGGMQAYSEVLPSPVCLSSKLNV